MAKTTTKAERTTRARETDAPPPAPDASATAPPAREHVCNVAFCPIGLALSTVQGAAPDVLEHLLKAAQEFFLAARAVMDNRAEDLQGRAATEDLQRIEIS